MIVFTHVAIHDCVIKISDRIYHAYMHSREGLPLAALQFTNEVLTMHFNQSINQNASLRLHL